MAGRRPVEEAFAARRPAVRLLVVPDRRAALEALVLHATTLRIPVVEVEGGTLTSLAGFDGHQGVALVVEPRRWATPEENIARAAARGEPPLVLILDSLEDPQNVGTLLRTAEAAGVHGVLFPTRRSAPLTAAAIKASAGATEHLLLCPVDDLAGAMVDLRTRGLRLIGADEDAPLSYRDADLRGPLALAVGSEGQGLSGHVRRRLDSAVRLPMRGRIASLNAAVAGSVLLFEAAAQRGGEVGMPPAMTGPGSGQVNDAAPEPEPEASATDEATREPAEAPAKPRRSRAKPAATTDDGPASPAEEPPTPRRSRAKRTVESDDGPASAPEKPVEPRRPRAKRGATAAELEPDPDAAVAPGEELLPGDG